MKIEIEIYPEYDPRTEAWRGAIAVNDNNVWTSDQAFEMAFSAEELAVDTIVEFFRRGFRYTP